jgi:two-component system nitrate/nitrite response regulator NarL
MTTGLNSDSIAVLSTCRYRAESLALALTAKTGMHAQAFARPLIEALVDFRIVVIELDADMESVSDLVRAVTARNPRAKVVLVGMQESEERVITFGEAGASAYAPANTSIEELANILQLVQDGGFICPPHITYALFSRLADLARSAHTSSPEYKVLTARQRQVLHLLSQNLTNLQIARHLGISQYTAKNHVHGILKKLGLRNRRLASRRPQMQSRMNERAISSGNKSDDPTYDVSE